MLEPKPLSRPTPRNIGVASTRWRHNAAIAAQHTPNADTSGSNLRAPWVRLLALADSAIPEQRRQPMPNRSMRPLSSERIERRPAQPARRAEQQPSIERGTLNNCPGVGAAVIGCPTGCCGAAACHAYRTSWRGQKQQQPACHVRASASTRTHDSRDHRSRRSARHCARRAGVKAPAGAADDESR
jgi:hypothetical protein